MRKLLLLLTVGLVVFLVAYRERLFLWDPLARVERGGVRDDHARVFINYSNDVLVQNDSGPTQYLYVVQNWNQLPGVPAHLSCVRFLVCLTDGDHARTVPAEGPVAKATMTNREVSFVDTTGAAVQVQLR